MIKSRRSIEFLDESICHTDKITDGRGVGYNVIPVYSAKKAVELAEEEIISNFNKEILKYKREIEELNLRERISFSVINEKEKEIEKLRNLCKNYDNK